jgi:hypothetical protein
MELTSCSFNSYVIVAPRINVVVVVVLFVRMKYITHGVEISQECTNKFQRGSSFVVIFVKKKSN